MEFSTRHRLKLKDVFFSSRIIGKWSNSGMKRENTNQPHLSKALLLEASLKALPLEVVSLEATSSEATSSDIPTK